MPTTGKTASGMKRSSSKKMGSKTTMAKKGKKSTASRKRSNSSM
jgi:hypothetical protein